MSKTVDPVLVQEISAGRARLKTPRAAAAAGILFAVMYSVSLVLIRLAVPEEFPEANAAAWLSESAELLSIALTLVPFSGIFFLWFIGVMRDRLGSLEDQFIATVLFGSGLLFLAMIFVSAAVSGAVVASYDMAAQMVVQSSVLGFGREVSQTVMNVYAVRMAGVFMISSGVLWIRTGVMPRGLALLTFGLALLLLFGPNLWVWITLVFPVWVFIISIFILVKRPLSAVAPDRGLTGVKEG
jgi:hypothetical protein